VIPPGDDLGRLRAAFAARPGPPAPGCPEPETLWAALHGELPAERRREVVDHLAACAPCAEDWRLAREAAGPLPAAAPGGAGSWLRGAWLAAAAALAVALGAGVFLRLQGPAPAEYRAGTAGEIRSLLADDARLPRERCRLLWAAPGPGARYEVRVSAEDLSILATVRDVEATELTVPEAALAAVPPGGRILWQVEARLPDGRRVVSRTFRARLS